MKPRRSVWSCSPMVVGWTRGCCNERISASAAESTRHLQHDFAALVWSTIEHFVSRPHVRQRQDGPDLRDDFASVEQSRNRAEPRRRDISVEECRTDVRTRGYEIRGNHCDENSARFQHRDCTVTSVAADSVDYYVNQTHNVR